MGLPERDLAQFASLAQSLADLGRDIIRRYFRQPVTVDYKEDETPVTAADREVEQAIRIQLNHERPQDGIIGEEYDDERTDAEFVWVVDPIDGTGSFMCGRPIFGTLIALLQGRVPILGIIDQPITGERWMGWRHGATLNGKAIRTRSCLRLTDAVLATTSPSLFSERQLAQFQRIESTARRTIYGGDCYNYGLLATGFLDVVVEAGLKPYDYCALVPIIEGAGGIVTNWNGNPLDTSSCADILAAGDARVHEEGLAILGEDRTSGVHGPDGDSVRRRKPGTPGAGCQTEDTR